MAVIILNNEMELLTVSYVDQVTTDQIPFSFTTFICLVKYGYAN